MRDMANHHRSTYPLGLTFVGATPDHGADEIVRAARSARADRADRARRARRRLLG